MLCEQKPAEPPKPNEKVESVKDLESKPDKTKDSNEVPKPESKSELKTDSKSEPKTELKPDSKTQSPLEKKQDIKPQDTESQPDTKTPDTKPAEKKEVKGLAGRKESLTAKVKIENILAFPANFYLWYNCKICIMLSYLWLNELC